MRVGVFGHAFHLFFAQAGRRSNGDLLVLARAHVFRGDVENAVGVNIERDLDLRHAARRRRKSSEVELAQRAIVLGHGPLPLHHVHLYRRLIVGCGRKCLRFLGWNGGVARDHLRGHAAQGFDAQRQRGHIQQQQIFHVAGQHACLHRRANGHHFIRIHAFVRLFAEQLLYQRLNARHARLSAHQHHFIDLAGVHAGIFHRLPARID